MIHFLESQAPCVYVPNYDYEYSCVSPKLSDKIIILGIIHSDDPLHYEHFGRLGNYWNHIVAVTRHISEKTRAMNPAIAKRLSIIPYGIPIPAEVEERSFEASRPIKIVYSGRLVESQKRISQLPKIFQLLQERNIPFEATIVGDGIERERFIQSCEFWINRGIVRWKGILPNEEVQVLYEEQDAIILTSEFEGLPVSILEAMARGCVPVCMEIPSGLPELIQNGQNGFLVPQGDIHGFADRLAELQVNPNQRKMLSDCARSSIRKDYEIGTMSRSYLSLIERLIAEVASGAYTRPSGKILVPPWMKTSWTNRLFTRIRLLRKKGSRYLRRVIYGSKHEKASCL
jgi:glycosyltransferase involved in cell wall biosynthesis